MKSYLSGFVTLTAGDSGRNPLTIDDLIGNNGWLNPNVAGVRLRLSHKVICPTENTRNYALLDAAVQQARKYNKKLRVCVAAGFLTADWVYTKGVYKYSNVDGTGSQPLPWDPAWQSIWLPFIDELSKRAVPSTSTSSLSLEKDPITGCVIPAGFSTEAGMYFASEADIPYLSQHLFGFPDVYAALQDGIKKILTKYATAFTTTPLEITYVAPINTPAGQATGKVIKDWFIATYPSHCGTMVSSVFANAQAGPPVMPKTKDGIYFPHSGQQFWWCYGNQNPASLYEKGTIVPNPIPPFTDIFVDMVDNALANGMFCLEIYQADSINIPSSLLSAQSVRLRANTPPGH